ncbi:MAG: hypothetical protein AB7P76_08955 [Candidatus Melainabacteria bacterium]
MSYKNDSELVILNKYSKANNIAKAELFETYDRLRDLTISGPTLGGSGFGKFASVLMNIARMFGAAPFIPTFGSEAVNIPGTSYYQPFTGGTAVLPGGQAAFGLAPFGQFTGFPSGGAASIDAAFSDITPLAMFSSNGIGSFASEGLGFAGIGDSGFPMESLAGGFSGVLPGGGVVAGGASALSTAGNITALGTGAAAGAGFGRNWVMPAAGIVSGIGGLLTTLGPFFGPFGLAAAAGGTVMSGLAGAALHSFQAVSQRILNNADTILTEKIKNLETTVKQLDAQSAVLTKLLKESVDSDKKALDNL